MISNKKENPDELQERKYFLRIKEQHEGFCVDAEFGATLTYITIAGFAGRRKVRRAFRINMKGMPGRMRSAMDKKVRGYFGGCKLF